MAPPKLAMAPPPNQPSLELSLDLVEGENGVSRNLDDLVRSIKKATPQGSGPGHSDALVKRLGSRGRQQSAEKEDGEWQCTA